LIRAGAASIPARRESLQKTVASLLPQVDRLGVYLNGYDDVPDFLSDERIDVARSQELGDRGDAGKMFWTDTAFDYYLACDDDVLYPPDYVTRLVEAIDHYQRRAIVGCHGVIMQERPKDYYRSRSRVYHGGSEVSEVHGVHLVATSSCGWHRSIPVRPGIFAAPNMADMWLAAWANEHDIPRVIVPHRKGWLKVAAPPSGTIWDASRARDGSAMDTSERQGAIARATPWRITPLPSPTPQRAVVSIITYRRQEALLLLLEDLERERVRFDGELQVRVYDDASPGYAKVRTACKKRGYAYWRAPKNYGREEHWRIVDRELSDLREIEADWYVFLPDDVRLCGDFFTRAVGIWMSLDDPTALNLAHHAGDERRWTRVEQREIGAGVETGWIDGMYICRRKLLERLDYRVPLPSEDWVHDWVSAGQERSSGVGKSMSEAIVADGARLYRPKRSLVKQQDVPSVMHPKLRERQPLRPVNIVHPFIPGEKGDNGAIRLSIVMMAHPRRRESVERILAALDRDCTVVWDEHNDRHDTGRRAMLAYDPESTHHAVIQDDVLVCRDLCAGLEQALAHVPDDVAVCGYVPSMRPARTLIEAAVLRAKAQCSSWIKMRTINTGTLIVVPTRLIPEMIACYDELERKGVPNYDRRISRFFELERNVPTYYTWPSLVDHADGPSLVAGRDGVDRANKKLNRTAHNFVGEDASALDLEWDRGVVDADIALDEGTVLLRHRVTGETLRLHHTSPRVRRLSGVANWELITT